MLYRNVLIVLAGTALVFTLGCSNSETGDPTKLVAECTQEKLPDEEWVCPEDKEFPVQCENGVGDPEVIYLKPSGDCEQIDELTLNKDRDFGVGTHDVVITAEADGDPVEMCKSTLNVVDTEDPQPKDEAIELWPPNHKFHTISGKDCVVDKCDGDDVKVTFSYASSDEPVNAKGDGNTEDDIILNCDSVQVRAERQGGSDGRVYKLGWKAVDDAGNPTEGMCIVTVPHDQSGRKANDSTPEGGTPPYEVELDEGECDDGTGGTGGEGGEGGTGGDNGEGGTGGDNGEGGTGGSMVVP